MKKFCALALSTIIATATLVAIPACDSITSNLSTSLSSIINTGKNNEPEYSETFEGSTSNDTYQSVEEAVTAYLSEEISGNAAQAELVDYQNQGELTSTEQNSLALSEEEKTGLASVEKIVVTYREVSSSAAITTSSVQADTAEETEEDTYTQVIYLLRYESGAFRYFVPAPSNGDTLTKSYFDSVLDPNKYLNVTFDFKSAYEAVQTYNGTSATYTYDWDATAKVAGHYLYEYDYIKQTQGTSSSSYATIMYALIQDGSMYEAYKTNSEDWVSGSYEIDGTLMGGDSKITDDEYIYKTVEGVLVRWFGSGVDYTYFEKTDNGFALRSNKMKEYITSLGYLSESQLEVLENFNAEYTIFVSEGRIYQCTSKISYKTDTTTFSASYTISPTEFGTTQIDVPADVQALLK